MNVYPPGNVTGSGTLSAEPFELTLDDDGTSAATEDHPRATLLRVVGMLRPVAVRAEVEAEQFSSHLGCEVRYAIVRLSDTTLRGEAALGYAQVTSTNLAHVDLFDSKGLGSEGIAFIRPFIMPQRPTTDPAEGLADVNGLALSIMQTLPWWHNNELTVLDLKSRRRIGQSSKMYLLRQVRFYNGMYIRPDGMVSCALHHLDYARVLLGGRE